MLTTIDWQTQQLKAIFLPLFDILKLPYIALTFKFDFKIVLIIIFISFLIAQMSYNVGGGNCQIGVWEEVLVIAKTRGWKHWLGQNWQNSIKCWEVGVWYNKPTAVHQWNNYINFRTYRWGAFTPAGCINCRVCLSVLDALDFNLIRLQLNDVLISI